MDTVPYKFCYAVAGTIAKLPSIYTHYRAREDVDRLWREAFDQQNARRQVFDLVFDHNAGGMNYSLNIRPNRSNALRIDQSVTRLTFDEFRTIDKRDVQCQGIRIENALNLRQTDCSQSQLKEIIAYFGPFFNNVHFSDAQRFSIPEDQLTALLSALTEIPFYNVRICDKRRFELYELFLKSQFEMDSLKEARFSFKTLPIEFKKDLEEFLTTKAYKKVQLSSTELDFGFYAKLLDEKIVSGYHSNRYRLLRNLQKGLQVSSSKRKIVWKRGDDVEITAHFSDDSSSYLVSFRSPC